MAVYLLRFDRPLGDPDRPGAHASYYIGSTPDARLVQRLTEHWHRSDACIVRAARASGRRFRLVRVWWGEGRPFERKLKKAGHYVRHDPAPPAHIPLTLREQPAPYAAENGCVPFPLGRLVATPGALAMARAHGLGLAALVARHQTGDWGDLCAEDRAANERALRTGARLLSRYDTPAGTLWVITEADRSATTVLRPDEY